MNTIDRLAEQLAIDVLKAQEERGQDRLYVEVGELLATSSQSLEEAFLTEMRVRLSEKGARALLARKLAAGRTKGDQ